MTKEYDNTNRGILFVNDRKEKDTHPDLKGSININGVEYWLSGWNKETQKGSAISLSVKLKEQADKPATTSKPARTGTTPAKRPEPQASGEDLNDDIPF